jgi:hypothetical protein
MMQNTPSMHHLLQPVIVLYSKPLTKPGRTLLLLSGFALLLEFLENNWNFKNFFQGPGKLLENVFLTSTPGKLLEISINSRCNI